MKLHQCISPLHTAHLDSAGIRSKCGWQGLIPQCSIADSLPLPTCSFSTALNQTLPEKDKRGCFLKEPPSYAAEWYGNKCQAVMWMSNEVLLVRDVLSSVLSSSVESLLRYWSSLELHPPNGQLPINWGWGTADLCCGRQRCRAIVDVLMNFKLSEQHLQIVYACVHTYSDKGEGRHADI